MEYNDGSYGRDPYGYEGTDTPNAGDNRSSNPYGQSMSYGRDYYDRSGDEYAQTGYGNSADQRGYGGRDGMNGAGGQYGYEDRQNTGRVSRSSDYANTGRTPMPGNTGRVNMSGSGEYNYSGRSAQNGDVYQGQNRQNRDGSYGYGNTGRTPMPGGYNYGGTGRIPNPANEEYGYSRRSGLEEDTGRTQMDPRAAYGSSGRYQEDEAYQQRPRQPKKKKKRSKASKFFRGLGAFIAQQPAKNLAIFGGVVAVALVGIILLVVLIPKGKDALPEDNGQLSITDITPTPSLAPTFTPVPEEILPTEAPTPNISLNGVVIKTVGEENDVIPSVQERLVNLGYMEMPTDGYTKRYGPATKTAIRLFQMKNYSDSKQWDGQLGDGTLSLLMGSDAKAYYLSRGDGDERTSSITKLAEDVKKLQDQLITLGYLAAGANTGVYGESTANAVKLFQQYHGLQADGKAGQATLTLVFTDQAMDAVTGKANDKSKQSPAPGAETAVAAEASTSPEVAAPPAATPGVNGETPTTQPTA